MAIISESTRQKMADYAHNTMKVGVRIGQEITLCVTSGALLQLVSHYLSKGQKKISRDLTRWRVVVAPILEEVIYRGAAQQIARLALNKILPSSAKEEGDGKEFWRVALRVHLTALSFSVAHLAVSHTHVWESVLQCSLCYLGGVSYGYLAEKYKTLSLPILAHGIDNALVSFAILMAKNKNSAPLTTALVALPVLADVGWYCLAMDRHHWAWLKGIGECLRFLKTHKLS